MKAGRVAEQQQQKQWTKQQQSCTVMVTKMMSWPLTARKQTLYTLIGGQHSADSDDQGDLLVFGHSVHATRGDKPAVQPSRKGKERKP